MKKTVGKIRSAIDNYNMIDENDKIAVGVSGGKDSLTLLFALSNLQSYYPKKFDLQAITLDLGFEGADFSQIQEFCNHNNINYTIKKTNIAEILFDIRKEKNPCSLCANLRRGALNNLALELGCNKVALGHHYDDVIETFFLSLFYEGRISCFAPVTYLGRKNIHIIRPLIYLPEKKIKSFAKKYNLPIAHNPCPANGNTKREYMKEFIKNLNYEHKGLKDRIFGAINRSKIDGWDGSVFKDEIE